MGNRYHLHTHAKGLYVLGGHYRPAQSLCTKLVGIQYHDAQWCKETLEEAISVHGKPEIINTDQGSQFTSEVFTHLVLSNDIKLSMDGKGRAIDNVFIERLWRSVKYESIYLNPPESGINLYEQIKRYFQYYNNERRHQGIDNQIPFKRYLIKQQKAA